MASVHESCWMNELFVNAAEVGGDTALSKTETTCSHGSPCYSHQSLICPYVEGEMYVLDHHWRTQFSAKAV